MKMTPILKYAVALGTAGAIAFASIGAASARTYHHHGDGAYGYDSGYGAYGYSPGGQGYGSSGVNEGNEGN
ncbi:MAG TPA: hypothetical protein VFB45_19910 [Pseudolabrys sp.]|nr:hypothetical protein [Pseudolabrys sp.]